MVCFIRWIFDDIITISIWNQWTSDSQAIISLKCVCLWDTLTEYEFHVEKTPHGGYHYIYVLDIDTPHIKQYQWCIRYDFVVWPQHQPPTFDIWSRNPIKIITSYRCNFRPKSKDNVCFKHKTLIVTSREQHTSPFPLLLFSQEKSIILQYTRRYNVVKCCC